MMKSSSSRKSLSLPETGMRISVILVEQDVNKALKTADRGYVIENGHVVLSGTSAELQNNEHVKRAYLGI
ncbi:MAG: hypothetical protein SPK67_05380 [Synergistales bacterium]|nr:hypothetical protein [Synergistales bacterium]